MAFFTQGMTMFMDPNFTGTGGGTTVDIPPFDILADTILVDLQTSAYTQVTSHSTFASTTATSLGAGGSGVDLYPGRGQQISTPTVTYTDGTGAVFDGVNTTFSSLGGTTDDTFTQINIQRETVTDTDLTTLLIANINVPNTLTNGGDITLVWDSAGILQLT